MSILVVSNLITGLLSTAIGGAAVAVYYRRFSVLRTEVTKLVAEDVNKVLNDLRADEKNAAIHPYALLQRVKSELAKL
jgi:hypothetical protein